MGRVVLVTGVCRDLGGRFARQIASGPSVDRVVVRINPEYRAQIQSRPSPVVSGSPSVVSGFSRTPAGGH